MKKLLPGVGFVITSVTIFLSDPRNVMIVVLSLFICILGLIFVVWGIMSNNAGEEALGEIKELKRKELLKDGVEKEIILLQSFRHYIQYDYMTQLVEKYGDPKDREETDFMNKFRDTKTKLRSSPGWNDDEPIFKKLFRLGFTIEQTLKKEERQMNRKEIHKLVNEDIREMIKVLDERSNNLREIIRI